MNRPMTANSEEFGVDEFSCTAILFVRVLKKQLSNFLCEQFIPNVKLCVTDCVGRWMITVVLD